jgi:hypothetical protein
MSRDLASHEQTLFLHEAKYLNESVAARIELAVNHVSFA